jgi:ATP-dependent DNA ligase
LSNEVNKIIGLVFKRAKTGKIQSYQISVFHHDDHSVISKLTGQLTGKKTEHNTIVRVGKQRRSIAAQAESEAHSDLLKKKDEGYKSLSELGVTGVIYVDDAPMIKVCSIVNDESYTEVMSLEAYLDKVLPKYNTDASGNVKPMLAHDFEKHKNKVIYPCYIQPKYDGVRCLLICNRHIVDGKIDMSITALSRNGKEYNTINHITHDIAAYLDRENILGTFTLDGEIYSDDLSFQDCVSAVKSLKDISKLLKFRAYDIVRSEKQEGRLALLKHIVEGINSNNIILTPTTVLLNELHILELFSKYIEQGYEGAMIRSKAGLYEQGTRSHSLLKYKKFDDGEFLIVGGKIEESKMSNIGSYDLNPTKEEHQSSIDSFVFTCQTEEGLEFDCKPTGTREHRAQLLRDFPRLIGSYMTVKYFGFTTSTVPRFPIGKGIRDYE